MSANNAPFGLRPINSAPGLNTMGMRRYENAIPSGYGTAIYKNSPVQMTGGTIIPVLSGTVPILGSFQGIEYTDSVTNRRRESNYWPASLTYGTTTPLFVYIADAEDNIFEVQLNGTGTSTLLGAQINMTGTVSGNGTTGLSSEVASNTPILAGTVQGQLAVIGWGLEPDNASTDAYPIVRVKVARGEFTAASLPV